MPDIRQERGKGMEQGKKGRSCQHGRSEGCDVGHSASRFQGEVGQSGLRRGRLAFQHRELAAP